jgi:hypothetical protein
MVERLHLPDAWIAIEHFWPATVERWLACGAITLGPGISDARHRSAPPRGSCGVSQHRCASLVAL